MYFISPDTPAYYLTSVAKDRLPVFRQDALKTIACSAIAEARTSCGFLIFAYVIMPDHLHLITDGEQKATKVLRFVNGIVGRRVIDFLKPHGQCVIARKTQA
jgi:REP element-mobilizing transposase RayT